MYRDPSYLIHQYIELDKTVPEIAESLGVSKATICKYMKRFGIKRTKVRKPKNLVTIKCENCFKPFKRYKGILSKHNFCGYDCYHAWMIDNTAGERSPNWRGGITAISSNGLKTVEWRTVRKVLFARFPFCVMCGSENYLQGHHIKTRGDRPDLMYSIDNLITLCRRCHAGIKGKEIDWEDYFTRIVRKSGELLETPNGNAEGNQQPSRLNVISIVNRKVQRLTGEESQTNKPDTSAAPERDDIVRAYGKP